MSTSSSERVPEPEAAPVRDPWWTPTRLCLAVGVVALVAAAWGWSAEESWGTRARCVRYLGLVLGAGVLFLAVLLALGGRWVRARRPEWVAPLVRLWRGVRWTLGLLVATLIVCEGWERYEYPVTPPKWYLGAAALNSRLFQPDADLGWIGIPGGTGAQKRDGHRVTIKHNSEGFLDVEPDPALEGRPCILVLGDSFARAADVPIAESLTGRLRTSFPDHLVLNQACVAYHLDQVILAYRKCAERRRPAVVVLAIIAAFNRVESYAMATGSPKPWCVERDGELHWYGTPVPVLGSELEERVHYCLQQDLDRITSVSEACEYLWNYWLIRDSALCISARHSVGKRFDPQFYDVDPMIQTLLGHLDAEVRADGAKLVVLVAPPDSVLRRKVPGRAMRPIVRMMESSGAEVLELSSHVEGRPVTDYYTKGNNRHPNAAGHALAARVLEARIGELLQTDSRE